jgi:glycosyltransferase involved in cell wall biosynthesis
MVGLIRLLYIGDHGSTGFGVVAKGILTGLHATGDYEILQLGINYNDLDGDPRVPWKVVPAGFYHPTSQGIFEASDPYGFTKAEAYINSYDPDVVLMNNDFPVVRDYMLRKEKKTGFAKHRSKKIVYAPMDSWPFPPVFGDIAKMFDQVIAYSYFQLDMMASQDKVFADVPVVYHGVDTETYFPMDKSLAKQMVMETFAKYNKDVKVPDLRNKFVVYFVGTNQWRKDLPALFRAFKAFNDKNPDAFLIPHTSAVPMSVGHGGWALYNLRDLTGVTNSVLFQNANVFTPTEMNYFYNAADVLAFPTRGEGFGLPSLEAMATKTPVIATRFGPQYEIHSDGRGYFIDVEDLIVGQRFAYTYFAQPSWKSLAERLDHVYHNRDLAKTVADTAYEWVKDQTWDSKALQVDRIIKECLRRLNPPSKSKSTSKRRKRT